MRYAQIKAGGKLHLVFEPGEGRDPAHLTPAGYLSAPLCGQRCEGNYRMTINVPLAHACKRCLRMWRSREKGGEE